MIYLVDVSDEYGQDIVLVVKSDASVEQVNNSLGEYKKDIKSYMNEYQEIVKRGHKKFGKPPRISFPKEKESNDKWRDMYRNYHKKLSNFIGKHATMPRPELKEYFRGDNYEILDFKVVRSTTTD